MRASSAGVQAIDIWDLLSSLIVTEDSIGWLLKNELEDLNFYDQFNRMVEDSDIWTSGGDVGGTFTCEPTGPRPTNWTLTTNNIVNEDWYLHGDVVNSKNFSFEENGYSIVTYETRVKLESIADISVLLGLFVNPVTDYAEPAFDCAQFLIDPAISATFRARSWETAEEETDTTIALDTDWHTFKIVWTSTSVLFYIDGVLVATHASEVPVQRLFLQYLVRTEDNAIKQLSIDYVSVKLS